MERKLVQLENDNCNLGRSVSPNFLCSKILAALVGKLKVPL